MVTIKGYENSILENFPIFIWREHEIFNVEHFHFRKISWLKITNILERVWDFRSTVNYDFMRWSAYKRIMFFSVSLSRIGTRFLFINSKSWRRFERRRKILSRHSEKWKMDRFLHVEERGKNFPSRIDCFPHGESSASARVVDSKNFFFKKTVWPTKQADVYRTVDITETPETKELVRVRLFLLFFIHRLW